MNGTSKHRTTGERLDATRARLRHRWRAGLVAALATTASAIMFALWLIPVVPIGLQSEELSNSVWVALVLAAGTALFGSITVLARNRVSGDRDIVKLLRGIIGMTDSRRLLAPRQFQRVLEKECLRAAEDRRSTLSLVLVRVESSQADQRAALHNTAEAILPYIRSSDVVGHVGGDEIGVLARGADAAACRRIADRLEGALADALEIWAGRPDHGGGALCLALGSATYRAGEDSGVLLFAARRAAHVAARRQRSVRSATDLSAAA